MSGDDSQFAGGFCYWNVRPSKRPATTERHIEPQAKLAGFIGRETDIIKELAGEIWDITQAVLRVVKLKRVNRLQFNSANACIFHGTELTRKLRLRYRGTKPPPAHHDPAIVGRPLKSRAHPVRVICEGLPHASQDSKQENAAKPQPRPSWAQVESRISQAGGEVEVFRICKAYFHGNCDNLHR
jgi:hypothetical protein